KIDSAEARNVETVAKNAQLYNPKARVIKAESVLLLDKPELIKGKRVLVIEDGPTTTHGDMRTGAAYVAAERYGAGEIVDPRPWVTGKIKETFSAYPNIGKLLPAMGYGPDQVKDLEETINRVDCDVVVIGTPIDLGRFIKINKPHVRVRYDLSVKAKDELKDMMREKGLI
ncbi:MAG: GTPase, partial [Candidatus Liptonbacteria bacterium]|nr:GTPase [Candidatus Liptonbacteria bacterium]